MSVPTIKKGNTFAFTAVFDDNGPVTGIANKLKAQVRDPFDKLLAELQISETGTQGTYLFRAEQNTEDWPIGQLLCDIQYSENDVVTSSETFYFNVVKDVTR